MDLLPRAKSRNFRDQRMPDLAGKSQVDFSTSCRKATLQIKVPIRLQLDVAIVFSAKS